MAGSVDVTIPANATGPLATAINDRGGYHSTILQEWGSPQGSAVARIMARRKSERDRQIRSGERPTDLLPNFFLL